MTQIEDMGTMRYKPSDKVRIKSLDWYNENKNENGYIDCGNARFIPAMSTYCGEVLTICGIEEEFSYYHMKECQYVFMDEMIEGLVEEEILIEKVDDNGLPFNEWLSHKGAFYIPDGYELKDENGNVINATKIVLEKKKKEYPKTYKECCAILGAKGDRHYFYTKKDKEDYPNEIRILDILDDMRQLLICRDVYWKIAGKEMGLGKPWEPNDADYITGRYCIFVHRGNIICSTPAEDCPLTFPTEEMRDVFYENFKELINSCKELL